MPTFCGNQSGGKVKRDANNCFDVEDMKPSNHNDNTIRKRIGIKLDRISDKLEILNTVWIFREMSNMDPKDIPQAGAMMVTPIAAQIALQHFIENNPGIGEKLLNNINKAFKNLPVSIKQHIAIDMLNQLTQSTGINFLKNSPLIIGPVINTIWSGINIYEAATKLNSGEGKNSEGILIFTIVSETAIMTCSLLQGGALAIGINIPGLNFAITTIVVIQQLAYAINNGIDKVKEVNKELPLTTDEKINLFFRNFIGKKLQDYLEDDTIAADKYNKHISKEIENAGKLFDIIVFTLPTIGFYQEVALKNSCNPSSWYNCGSKFKKCTPQGKQNIHFSNEYSEAAISIKSFNEKTSNISRVIGNALKPPQKYICGLNNKDVTTKIEVIKKCDSVNAKSGSQTGKLNLHTKDDNLQNNICDSAVVIDLDSNNENSNILYNLDGIIHVEDPTTNITSYFMIDHNTNVTRAPMGTNQFFLKNSITWDENQVTLSGDEEYNVVHLTASKDAVNFNPDTKIDSVIAKDCATSISYSPSVKSLGNNTLTFQGDYTQQLVEVGLNDNYSLDLKGSSKIRFKVDVSNASDNDTLTVNASSSPSETEVIISINTQFIFLRSLKYNNELREWTVTLSNSQEIKIYNYAKFKNCILEFNNGVSIDLKQFQGLTGNINISDNTTPILIIMIPPASWSTDSIIDYLKGIEISQFYETFKFNLLITTRDKSSFYGHINNVDKQIIIETTRHLINYFSLGGSNNNIIIKNEVDIYIVQHNTQNIAVRFAPDANWEYKPSNISYKADDIKVEYMKTQTDYSFQVEQVGALPAINIITGNNTDSSLRMFFRVGNSYVIKPGEKTLTQDNAIILDVGERAIISAAQLQRLDNKIYLPEIEVEEAKLIFNEKDELILAHPKYAQGLHIKGNKDEIQILFKNTNGYEIYPVENNNNILVPPIEREFDISSNPYIILSYDMPQLFIAKILSNGQEVSIHNIAIFSQNKDALTLNMGEQQLTIYGWDSCKLLRPILLFKNNVSLNLNNLDVSQIIEINQFIEVQRKLAVIEHQSQNLSNIIEILDKIAFTLGSKSNPQCNEIINQTGETYKSEEVELLVATPKSQLAKAVLWWGLNKYYTLKSSHPDKSQKELVNHVQECTSPLVDEKKLQQLLNSIEAVENIIPSELRNIVHNCARKGLKIKKTLNEILNNSAQEEVTTEEDILDNQDNSAEMVEKDETLYQLLFVGTLLESEFRGPEESYYTSGAQSAGGSSIINNIIAVVSLFTRIGNINFLKFPAHKEFIKSKDSLSKENSPPPQHNDVAPKSMEMFGNNYEGYKSSNYQFVIEDVQLLIIKNDGVPQRQHIASMVSSALFPTKNGWVEQTVFRGCHNLKTPGNKQYLINNIKDDSGIYVILSGKPSSVCIDFYYLRDIIDEGELPSWALTCRKPQSSHELLIIPKKVVVEDFSNVSNNTNCLAQIISIYNMVASIPSSNDQHIVTKTVANTAAMAAACTAASLVDLPIISLLQFVPSINNYFNLIKHSLPENCSHKDFIATLGTGTIIGIMTYSPAIQLLLSAHTVYNHIKSLMPESDYVLDATGCVIVGASNLNFAAIINSGPVQVSKGLNNLQYISAIFSILKTVTPYIAKPFNMCRSYFGSKKEEAQSPLLKITIEIKNLIEEIKDLDLSNDHQYIVNNISNLLSAVDEQNDGFNLTLEQLKGLHVGLQGMEGKYYHDTIV